MSYAACEALPPSMPWANERGVSAESVDVDRHYADALRHILTPVVEGSPVSLWRDVLEDLKTSYAEDNWDGYGARAVSQGAIERAFQFLNALPPAFRCADVTAGLYGDVEVEWYLRPDKVLTMSIGEDGRYYFASMNGLQKRSGSGYVSGLPLDVLRNVRQVLTDR